MFKQKLYHNLHETQLLGMEFGLSDIYVMYLCIVLAEILNNLTIRPRIFFLPAFVQMEHFNYLGEHWES
jgi:hypothetical protein